MPSLLLLPTVNHQRLKKGQSKTPKILLLPKEKKKSENAELPNVTNEEETDQHEIEKKPSGEGKDTVDKNSQEPMKFKDKWYTERNGINVSITYMQVLE